MATLKLNDVTTMTESGGTVTMADGVALGTPASGTLTNATFPAGHILQVIQHITATEIANTTNPDDVDLMEKAITPKTSTSKILIALNWYEGNSNPNGAYRLMRDGTSIVNSHSHSDGTGFAAMDDLGVGNSYAMESFHFTYLDSPTIPSTPIPITYKLSTHSSSSVYFNCQIDGVGGGTSTITLWEIAG